MPDREKVIKGLETCGISGTREDCEGYGCPYFIYNDEVSDECQVHLFKDALTLLKAQEPRVMTLEEALGADECWLERRDGSVTVADIALNGRDKGGYDVDSNELSTMRSYIFHSGYYGKFWRCWTARPTEEQREKVKWNG